MASLEPPSPPLANDVVRLAPLEERHLEGLAALGRDPEVARFSRVPVPFPDGFERRWLALYREGWLAASRAGFAIEDPTGGSFLGLGALFTIDLAACEAEIGYLVLGHARGRGVATAALRLLTDWALALGLARLELRIDVTNAPSLRVAEKVGYVREGVLRSVHLKQDIRIDTAIYSLLPSDANG